MRSIVLAALAVLALSACSKPAETAAATAPASPPAGASPVPAADSMAKMPGMDAAAMAGAAAADAGPLQITPDNHMFHVLQGVKEVKVVLPATGAWAPDKPSSDLYSLADSTKATLADGSAVEVFRFMMQKSGNATIVFTKPAGPADKAAETRTVMFMIH